MADVGVFHAYASVPKDIMSEAKYDVKEDEEQEIKFQEISELLVAAGYFRARIKGLSPFDKVVGGMTWCIQNCAVYIDVNLLYQENSSIGQKISLTEKIVSVLPKMKCPVQIEPHQIQGLDFINIFPVIQWLVKKALETRGEREIANRAYSLREFEKLNGKILENGSLKTVLTEFSDLDIPKRKLQPIKPFDDKDDAVKVSLTLLEYGNKIVTAKKTDDLEASSATDLIDEMTETKAKKKIDTNVFNNILGMKKDELNNAAAEYLKMREEANQNELEENSLSLSKKIDILVTQEAKIDEKLKELKEQENDLASANGTLSDEIDQMRCRIDQNIHKIKITTPEKDQEFLTKMRKLISMNEKLKKNETDFRLTCKDELKELDERNKLAKENLQKLAIYDAQNEETIALKKQLGEARLKLAKRTRLVMELERKIDSIPSRAELSQYQRRFVELYNQISSKQNETQNYFDMYNNLCDQRDFIEKEIKLMNLIQEGFEKSSDSQHTKYQYVAQLEEILKGVKEGQKRAKDKLTEKEQVKERIIKQKQELMFHQQQYFTLVKKIQDEVKKNAIINSKLEELDAKIDFQIL